MNNLPKIDVLKEEKLVQPKTKATGSFITQWLLYIWLMQAQGLPTHKTCSTTLAPGHFFICLRQNEANFFFYVLAPK